MPHDIFSIDPNTKITLFSLSKDKKIHSLYTQLDLEMPAFINQEKGKTNAQEIHKMNHTYES